MIMKHSMSMCAGKGEFCSTKLTVAVGRRKCVNTLMSL
jgi:hypothetical protein